MVKNCIIWREAQLTKEEGEKKKKKKMMMMMIKMMMMMMMKLELCISSIGIQMCKQTIHVDSRGYHIIC
jgi:hypothetical protein